MLTELYHSSDKKCQYATQEDKKTLKVIPDKRQFVLSDEADSLFGEIHNDFEYNKAKKYESDNFIPGNFSITKLSPKQGHAGFPLVVGRDWGDSPPPPNNRLSPPTNVSE